MPPKLTCCAPAFDSEAAACADLHHKAEAERSDGARVELIRTAAKRGPTEMLLTTLETMRSR